MSQKPFDRTALAAAILGAASCSVPSYRIHHGLLDPDRDLPEAAILLAPGIAAGEVLADGSLEEIPLRSFAASQAVEGALRERFTERGILRFVELPELSPEEASLLEEHLALFDLVGWTALTFPGPDLGWPDVSAWRERLDRFDATLGPGLAFLRDRTGAEAVLVTLGSSYLAGPGPFDASFLSALFGGGERTGVSKLLLGLVDLRTGDLLWLHHSVDFGSLLSSTRDLRDPEVARDAIEKLLQDFPARRGNR